MKKRGSPLLIGQDSGACVSRRREDDVGHRCCLFGVVDGDDEEAEVLLAWETERGNTRGCQTETPKQRGEFDVVRLRAAALESRSALPPAKCLKSGTKVPVGHEWRTRSIRHRPMMASKASERGESCVGCRLRLQIPGGPSAIAGLSPVEPIGGHCN